MSQQVQRNKSKGTLSGMDRVRNSQNTLLSSKSINDESFGGGEGSTEVRLKNEHVQSLLDLIQEKSQPDERELMESTYGKDAAAAILTNSLFTADQSTIQRS